MIDVAGDHHVNVPRSQSVRDDGRVVLWPTGERLRAIALELNYISGNHTVRALEKGEGRGGHS